MFFFFADSDSLAAVEVVGHAASVVEAAKDKDKFLGDNQYVFFDRHTFEFLRGAGDTVTGVQSAPDCQADLVARSVSLCACCDGGGPLWPWPPSQPREEAERGRADSRRGLCVSWGAASWPRSRKSSRWSRTLPRPKVRWGRVAREGPPAPHASALVPYRAGTLRGLEEHPPSHRTPGLEASAKSMEATLVYVQG